MKKFMNTAIAAALAAIVLAGTVNVHAAETKEATININTATVAELSFLPGVGASKAEAIIAHRGKSPFKKVEQIMKVKGIGRKSFQKMLPYLTVEGPTTATRKISVKK